VEVDKKRCIGTRAGGGDISQHEGLLNIRNKKKDRGGKGKGAEDGGKGSGPEHSCSAKFLLGVTLDIISSCCIQEEKKLREDFTEARRRSPTRHGLRGSIHTVTLSRPE